MKVLSVLGSPRKGGNSDYLAQETLKPLQEVGAQIKTHRLNDLSFRGCQACMACKTKRETCILEDDLNEVMEDFKEADVLIFASPVYYGDVSGQFKCFFDRTFEFLTPDYTTAENPSRLAEGKRCAFVLVQGAPDPEQFEDIFPRYTAFLDWYGVSEIHEVRACGVYAKDAIKEAKQALEEAQSIGRTLAAQ